MTWITVEVDVDLSEFDDSAIEAEYNSRGLGSQPAEYNSRGLGSQPTESGGREELMAIRQLVLAHKTEEAYKRMYDYIRNRLGTAI